ncbi:MAG: ribbon-helix-helix protein, CopG family [Paracoccaceae bacterium]|nr:ribbon-helix-helix protein, CopG family [Paracoccaceae bacterium]
MAPPKKDTTGIMLRLPAEMLKAIDDIRRQEEDIPTRPEMVRRIIAQYMKDRSDAR